VIYHAGSSSSSDIPEPIRLAILLLVGHWYEHREATIVKSQELIDTKLGVDRLLAPYKTVRV